MVGIACAVTGFIGRVRDDQLERSSAMTSGPWAPVRNAKGNHWRHHSLLPGSMWTQTRERTMCTFLGLHQAEP